MTAHNATGNDDDDDRAQALECLRSVRLLEDDDLSKMERGHELDDQGVASKAAAAQQQRGKQAPGGDIKKLLNRLLGVPVDMQSRVFELFHALMAAEVRQAKADNK